MKRTNTIAALLALVCCGRSQNIDDLRKLYTFDDFGVYIENPTLADHNPDRYTLDNKAYRIDKRFVFDYFIIKDGDTLQITAPKFNNPEADFQHVWDFIPRNLAHEDKIETISITVLPGISNENQTMLKYEYQFTKEDAYNTFSSTSGVIENEMNTWMHPHRDKYFMILELNPFPFIQQPFKPGTKWKWNLAIGDHWNDPRWKTWAGSIRNEYEYEIIGMEKLQTSVGEMDCWIVQGIATSSIGSTGLIAYYNEENGFVKLDYVNIDRSRLTIKIKEIQ